MDLKEAAQNEWGLEHLMNVREVAAHLRVPVSTVYDWRTRGLGPPAHRFGKHLAFAVSDLQSWIEEHRDPIQPVSGSGALHQGSA
ncbi:helix-turn-helix domain-containing protein [Microbacterium sp. SS28]|uniref:helix-turn-helix domain-containing protein n=1 Tax=Microbacterium sp. SS28 TaxID=2919948 RepID=UPI001FAB29E5|nr:helix-turn-helix domain-containing protein [Microbacterium sp. SS28]